MINFLKYLFFGILLVSFMTYTCGFHFYFNAQLENIREINFIADGEYEEHHEIVELKIPVEEVHFIHDHEFEWNGLKYDILKKDVRDGWLICLAYCDIEETETENDYKNEQKRRTQNNQDSKSIQPFISQNNSKQYIDATGVEMNSEYQKFLYSILSAESFSPPPRN